MGKPRGYDLGTVRLEAPSAKRVGGEDGAGAHMLFTSGEDMAIIWRTCPVRLTERLTWYRWDGTGVGFCKAGSGGHGEQQGVGLQPQVTETEGDRVEGADAHRLVVLRCGDEHIHPRSRNSKASRVRCARCTSHKWRTPSRA